MRKPWHNLLSLLALLVVGAGTMFILGTTGQTASAAVPSGPTNQNQGHPMKPSSPGSPALQPRLAAIPAFTAADVEQFLMTKGFPRGLGQTVTGTKPTITKIVFVTSKQASDMMAGESIGLPDTAVVCYVELQGPFSTDGFSHPAGARSGVYQTGRIVFDARTGNILLFGAH